MSIHIADVQQHTRTTETYSSLNDFELVHPVHTDAVCGVLRSAFAEAPHTRGFTQLTGRFAVETMHHPLSDFSRLIRTEILTRGHSLRLLADRGVMTDPRSRTLPGGARARQVQLRVTDAPLPDLALLGTELGLVRTMAPDGRLQILLARREATAALLQFQQVLWGHAEGLTSARDVRELHLDEIQRQVLQMLGSGMKDDTAARQMNVSVRTYRRHVAAILKSLDVSTRFEAGIRAAEYGLVSAT
jgi:DNA-binding CsgD family transcriptional regulator